MKKIYIVMFFIFTSVVSSFAQMGKVDVQTNFVLANESYKQKDYAQAIELYENIVSNSWESGTVYYNLGNSYYKQGNIGKAILNYERARKFLKRDRDFRFNYRYIQGQVVQTSQLSKAGFLKGLMQKHVEFYIQREMLFIIAMLCFLFPLIQLLGMYFKIKIKARANIFLVVLLLTSVFVFGLCLDVNQNKNTAIVVIKGQTMFEPNAQSTVHFSISEGEKIYLELKKDGWVKIRREDGKRGWILDEHIELI
jgi:tetratricopeptide (TPR) repeat protein